jgi:hypothetical protein
MLEAWGLSELLVRQRALRVLPDPSGALRVKGGVRCWAVGPDGVEVDETFALEIQISDPFPDVLPRVYETADRIPRDFHRLEDEALCLGSNTAQRLAMGCTTTLAAFIDRVIVPYLYGFLRFESTGRMPFGELAHGAVGLEDEVRRVFRMPPGADALAVLVLAAQHRRVSNKRPCPCDSGRRVGRCHRAQIHRMRDRLGRAWFQREVRQLRIQRCAEAQMGYARGPAMPRWMRR